MAIPLAEFAAAPFTGPFHENAQMIPSAAAAPFEGVWVPAKFLRAATLELAGSMATVNVDIYGSNAQNPANEYTVTVGGTITAGDVATVTATNPNLLAGSASAAYTVLSTDTVDTIATGLGAAINASAGMAAVGISASVAGAVVTVAFPSALGDAGAASSPYQFPAQNTTALSGSVSGSATETLTFAASTTGTKIVSLTALGITQASVMPVRWIKGRLTTLTGSGANISLTLQGSA